MIFLFLQLAVCSLGSSSLQFKALTIGKSRKFTCLETRTILVVVQPLSCIYYAQDKYHNNKDDYNNANEP